MMMTTSTAAEKRRAARSLNGRGRGGGGAAVAAAAGGGGSGHRKGPGTNGRARGSVAVERRSANADGDSNHCSAGTGRSGGGVPAPLLADVAARFVLPLPVATATKDQLNRLNRRTWRGSSLTTVAEVGSVSAAGTASCQGAAPSLKRVEPTKMDATHTKDSSTVSRLQEEHEARVVASASATGLGGGSKRRVLDALLLRSGRAPSVDLSKVGALGAVVSELESAAAAAKQREENLKKETIEQSKSQSAWTTGSSDNAQAALVPSTASVLAALSLGSQRSLLQTLNRKPTTSSVGPSVVVVSTHATRGAVQPRAGPQPTVASGARQQQMNPPCGQKIDAVEFHSESDSRKGSRVEECVTDVGNSVDSRSTAIEAAVGAALPARTHAEMKVNQLSKLIMATPDISHITRLFFQNGNIVAAGEMSLRILQPNVDSAFSTSATSFTWVRVRVRISHCQLCILPQKGVADEATISLFQTLMSLAEAFDSSDSVGFVIPLHDASAMYASQSKATITYATSGANDPSTQSMTPPSNGCARPTSRPSADEPETILVKIPSFPNGGTVNRATIPTQALAGTGGEERGLRFQPLHESEGHAWLLLLQTCVDLAREVATAAAAAGVADPASFAFDPRFSLASSESLVGHKSTASLELSESAAHPFSNPPDSAKSEDLFTLATPGLRGDDDLSEFDPQAFLAELLPFVLKNHFSMLHGMGSAADASSVSSGRNDASASGGGALQHTSALHTFLFKNELCSYRQHGSLELAALHREWADAFPEITPLPSQLFRSFIKPLRGGTRGAGKSTALFYVSSDTKFVLKTCNASELGAAARLVPKYRSHMARQGGHSAINHIFALTEIGFLGQTYNFVVLNNILSRQFVPSTPDCVFDLKGCDFRRKTKIPKSTTFRLSTNSSPVSGLVGTKPHSRGPGVVSALGSAIGEAIRNQLSTPRVDTAIPLRAHKPRRVDGVGLAAEAAQATTPRGISRATAGVVDPPVLSAGAASAAAPLTIVEDQAPKSSARRKSRARMSRRSSDALFVQRSNLPLLKDGNMFLSFHVDDPLVHRKFLGMVAADAAFLGTSNIMDYSLLLGVAFHTPREFGSARSEATEVSGWSTPFRTGSNATCWSHRLNCWAGIEDPVGLMNSGAHELWLDIFKHANRHGRVACTLYFGIIDIFQEFNFIKRMAMVMKLTTASGATKENISTVESSAYASRFYAFLERLFVHDPNDVDVLERLPKDLVLGVPSTPISQSVISKTEDGHTPTISSSASSRQILSQVEAVPVFTVDFHETGSLGFRLIRTDSPIEIAGRKYNSKVINVCGPAKARGVSSGMVIVEVNGISQENRGVAEVMQKLASAAKRRPLTLGFFDVARCADCAADEMTQSGRDENQEYESSKIPETVVSTATLSAPPAIPALPSMTTETRQRMRRTLRKPHSHAQTNASS